MYKHLICKWDSYVDSWELNYTDETSIDFDSNLITNLLLSINGYDFDATFHLDPYSNIKIKDMNSFIESMKKLPKCSMQLTFQKYQSSMVFRFIIRSLGVLKLTNTDEFISNNFFKFKTELPSIDSNIKDSFVVKLVYDRFHEREFQKCELNKECEIIPKKGTYKSTIYISTPNKIHGWNLKESNFKPLYQIDSTAKYGFIKIKDRGETIFNGVIVRYIEEYNTIGVKLDEFNVMTGFMAVAYKDGYYQECIYEFTGNSRFLINTFDITKIENNCPKLIESKKLYTGKDYQLFGKESSTISKITYGR